jgi:hypothetical protein
MMDGSPEGTWLRPQNAGNCYSSAEEETFLFAKKKKTACH